MTKLLAIDTSLQACSAALNIDGEINETFTIAPREHAQLILPMIETLLSNASLKLTQLDAIAFACGPGGFTGLRIAAGITQGLAYAVNLPVVPVSTLQTMAQGAYHKFGEKNVLVAVDAKMHEIYWGAYSLDGQGIMQAVVSDCLTKPEKLSPPADMQWFQVGDATEQVWHPQAKDVALIAQTLFSQSKTVSPENAQPIYLRGRDAWVKAKAA